MFNSKNSLIYQIFYYLDKHALLICLVILGLSFLPAIILRQDGYIKIIDCLDIEFTHRFILSTNFNYLKSPPALIECIMGGIPRHCLPSTFSIVQLLFILFSPIWAYIINDILVHVIAYFGMFVFLKTHIFSEEDFAHKSFLISVIALSFAMLPFFSIFGISIAGQPLLFYAYLNILNNKFSSTDYLIIFTFPFYSWFVFSGVFIISALFCLFLFYWLYKKQFCANFLITLTIQALLYLLVEYNLIYAFIIDKSYISHRVERNLDFWKYSAYHFFNACYSNFFGDSSFHFSTLHLKIANTILPLAISVGIGLRLNMCGLLSNLTLIITILAFCHALWCPYIIAIRQNIPFLLIFDWTRFLCLLPMMWYIVCGQAILIISKIKQIGPILGPLLVIIQLSYVIQNNLDFRHNTRFLCCKFFKSTQPNYPSYKQYFDENLFNAIKNTIQIPTNKYKIICVGFDPAIAQYNGFHTLDGYAPNYPLKHKHLFRKVIEKELNKDEQLCKWYDFFGNRCHIAVNELNNDPICVTGFYGEDANKCKYINLDLNTDQLQIMKCDYLFSTAEIVNYEKNNLQLIKIFNSNINHGKVMFVYKIKNTK